MSKESAKPNELSIVEQRILKIEKMNDLNAKLLDDSVEKYFKEFGQSKGFDTFLVCDPRFKLVINKEDLSLWRKGYFKDEDRCYTAVFIANKEGMISDKTISENDLEKMKASLPEKNGGLPIKNMDVFDYDFKQVG